MEQGGGREGGNGGHCDVSAGEWERIMEGGKGGGGVGFFGLRVSVVISVRVR